MRHEEAGTSHPDDTLMVGGADELHVIQLSNRFLFLAHKGAICMYLTKLSTTSQG